MNYNELNMLTQMIEESLKNNLNYILLAIIGNFMKKTF